MLLVNFSKVFLHAPCMATCHSTTKLQASSTLNSSFVASGGGKRANSKRGWLLTGLLNAFADGEDYLITFVVKFRFSEFDALDKRIRDSPAGVAAMVSKMFPNLPKKKLFGNNTPQFIEQRQVELASYVRVRKP